MLGDDLTFIECLMFHYAVCGTKISWVCLIRRKEKKCSHCGYITVGISILVYVGVYG